MTVMLAESRCNISIAILIKNKADSDKHFLVNNMTLYFLLCLLSHLHPMTSLSCIIPPASNCTVTGVLLAYTSCSSAKSNRHL